MSCDIIKSPIENTAGVQLHVASVHSSFQKLVLKIEMLGHVRITLMYPQLSYMDRKHDKGG